MPTPKGNSPSKKWYESIEKISVITGAMIVLFTAGYATGSYKADIDCKMEKMKLQQDYDEKLQQINIKFPSICFIHGIRTI